MVAALAVITPGQVAVWQNSNTLWTHVITHQPQHYLGYQNRAHYEEQEGQLNYALSVYSSAIERHPNDEAYSSRGLVHQQLGALELAEHDFVSAIELNR